jgi:hypothetical protein
MVQTILVFLSSYFALMSVLSSRNQLFDLLNQVLQRGEPPLPELGIGKIHAKGTQKVVRGFRTP